VKYYRLNNKIICPKVCLIDEENKHIGDIETEKALALTREKGLDLVEIGPKANPPVAKIINFGQFKYDLKKKDRQQKKQQKSTNLKGIRLTPRISEHDLMLRAKKAEDFLNKGHKVKIEMILKGREKAHFDLAEQKMNKFVEALGNKIKIDQNSTRQGNSLITIISF